MPRPPSEKRAADVMLDSGAFSAYKSGGQISLDAYASFLRVNAHMLHCHINLDCIPGRHGKNPSNEEVEQAAAKSFTNYEALRGMGFDPMPVFHCGEGIHWLERLLDAGAEYIGLGGTVGKRTHLKLGFFRQCFATIKKSKRAVRTHGFGCTTASIMAAFPFTTVDSTRWAKEGINGGILVPAMGSGQFNYRSLRSVGVTGLGEARDQVGGMGALYRGHVMSYLEQVGVTLEELRIDQAARNYVNLHTISRMCESCGCEVYFSTWLCEPNQGRILTKANISRRLLSYWEIKDEDPAELAAYVMTGVAGKAAIEIADFASSWYIRKRTMALMTRLSAEQ